MTTNASHETEFSIWDRRLVVIMLVVFVQLVGAAMVLPILPLYAQQEFGMQPAEITLLITAFFAAQFVAGPFIGRLSDQYGRVPVLVVSQIGTVISFLALGLAGSIWMLFAARILDGITGGNIIVAQAYITDIAPKERRTEALGYLFLAFGVGFIVGPAVGGLLSSQFSYHTPYIFAAISAAIVVVLTIFFVEETVSDEQRTKNKQRQQSNLNMRAVLRNNPLMAILGAAFGAQFAFSMLQSTFSLYGEAVIFANEPERVTLGVGLLLAVIGVGQVITQLFLIKQLVKRFGESPLVVVGGIFRSLSMAILLVFPAVIPVALSMLFFAIGTGMQMPALQSLIADTVSDDERGAVLGIYQSSISLSIIIGSGVAGILFAIAPYVPYALGTGIYVLMLVPGFFLMRWAKREEDKRHHQQAAPARPAISAGD